MFRYFGNTDPNKKLMSTPVSTFLVSGSVQSDTFKFKNNPTLLTTKQKPKKDPFSMLIKETNSYKKLNKINDL